MQFVLGYSFELFLYKTPLDGLKSYLRGFHIKIIQSHTAITSVEILRIAESRGKSIEKRRIYARFCESTSLGGLESRELDRDSSFCESKKKQKLLLRIFL